MVDFDNICGAIKNENGTFIYNAKSDLEAEEGNGYLPEGIKNIIELAYIESSGIGRGKYLMSEFLELPEVKSSDAIYLDPNPGHGCFDGAEEKETVNKLVRFYGSFGFRYNPKSAMRRMWIMNKFPLDVSLLPC